MNSNVVSGKIMRQLCSVRRKKINRIKSKITSGRYKVDNLELAKALFFSR